MNPEDRLIAWLVVISILLGCCGLLTRCTGCMSTYSQGQRTGVVVKMSHKGFMFKSWDGLMNLGGMRSGKDGTSVPNVWDFTTMDATLAERVQQYSKSGQRVTITYHQWLIAPWTLGSDYEIESIQADE